MWMRPGRSFASLFMQNRCVPDYGVGCGCIHRVGGVVDLVSMWRRGGRSYVNRCMQNRCVAKHQFIEEGGEEEWRRCSGNRALTCRRSGRSCWNLFTYSRCEGGTGGRRLVLVAGGAHSNKYRGWG
jgi:hypothetical protein